MTNSVNVEFIVEKLLAFLSVSTDDHFRSDLVGRICQCGERFAPSNLWYVSTMIRVFELAGDKVNNSVGQTLMQLIAEGGNDETEDFEGSILRQFLENVDPSVGQEDELRIQAVENFIDLLQKPKLPPLLAEV